jgi:hypothetical protein
MCSWSLFVCPTCGWRARVLRSLNGVVVCQECCLRRGVYPRSWPMSVGDRALFEERIAKLTEQLAAESAARLFAEGALRSARQERSARRQEGHDVAAESTSAETESADSKVTWLRR